MRVDGEWKDLKGLQIKFIVLRIAGDDVVIATTVGTLFDARNGVDRRYTPIFVTRAAPPGTHRRAAVVQAAYVALKAFYPEQSARFDTHRASSLAEFQSDDPASVQRGIEWGGSVASQVLAWRAADGFANPVAAFSGAGAAVGQWESATGAAMALAGIEMALSGVRFPIPVDEVIDTMGEIGRQMDVRYRETAGGGLAATPTGRKLAKQRLVELKGKPA